MPNAHISDVMPIFSAALGFDRPEELFGIWDLESKNKLLFLGYEKQCIDSKFSGFVKQLFYKDLNDNLKLNP